MAKSNKNNKNGKSGAEKSVKPNQPKAASKKAGKKNDVEESFPAEAPVAPGTTPEASAPETPRETETTSNADAPEAANRFAGEQAPKDSSAPVSAIPEHLKHVGPRTPHSDELKLEKFLIANKITKMISQDQLSKSGINMTKINLLNGRIGKFKLKRNFRQEKFVITIVE